MLKEWVQILALLDVFWDVGSCLGAFGQCQEHSVIFTPQPEDDGDNKISQAQIAKVAPVKHWTSLVTTVGWHVKRTQKGISPIRPIVLVTTDVSLDNGKVLVLQS